MFRPKRGCFLLCKEDLLYFIYPKGMSNFFRDINALCCISKLSMFIFCNNILHSFIVSNIFGTNKTDSVLWFSEIQKQKLGMVLHNYYIVLVHRVPNNGLPHYMVAVYVFVVRIHIRVPLLSRLIWLDLAAQEEKLLKYRWMLNEMVKSRYGSQPSRLSVGTRDVVC